MLHREGPVPESKEGLEAVYMTRKGQLKRISGEDVVGRAGFVAGLYGVAASSWDAERLRAPLSVVCNTTSQSKL